ncbi:hypothetical protein AAF712_007872 [Marasmius tenuissimus]|uniref:Uncharacterized protein n=1 Tax=Marasmius tenuissimus TaxID=585030 RepID=A0ABR2ZY34_9AGAR
MTAAFARTPIKGTVENHRVQAPTTSFDWTSGSQKTSNSNITAIEQLPLAYTPRKSRPTSKTYRLSYARARHRNNVNSSHGGIRQGKSSLPPPTVEEIAKGLHLPRRANSAGFSRSKSLPPPRRSAMKNSTLNGPPASTRCFVPSIMEDSLLDRMSRLSFKSRVSRAFLSLKVQRRPSLASTLTASRSSMESEPDFSPAQKSVRFVVDQEHTSNAFGDDE